MKRTLLLLSGGLLVIALLAGAAFVGGRLLRPTEVADDSTGMELVVEGSGDQVMRSVKELEVTPAAELPATPPDLGGVFVRREDNALFVGTGKITTSFIAGEGGSGQAETNFDGPVLEVVVTRDTQIYRDDTFRSGEPPAGEIQQQVVNPGSLDEIDDESMISAWGEKRGDRLIADILLYNGPTVVQGP